MLRRWVSALGRLAAAPLVAAGFLTVLPVPAPRSLAMGPMGWPVACFPLAGATLAAVVAAVGVVLDLWLPPQAVAPLLIASLLAITGALHLDGLIDSFDGLFGGRDPADRRTIMKDSRVGSFGLAAAGSMLLTEYGALVAMPVEARSLVLVAAGALSRWAMVATLWGFPAAGSKGLAAGLKPHLRWIHAAVATLLAATIALGAMGWAGGAAMAIACLLVGLGGRLAVARLGGITGDICGGLGQMVEAAVLLVAVAAW
ncbi:MAG: adenosylcobinamide-GDP ribazoletransferase [Sphingomonadaceae bacterium]